MIGQTVFFFSLIKAAGQGKKTMNSNELWYSKKLTLCLIQHMGKGLQKYIVYMVFHQ